MKRKKLKVDLHTRNIFQTTFTRIFHQIGIPLEDEEIVEATNEFMKILVKQQMGTRLLKLVDELAIAYG